MRYQNLPEAAKYRWDIIQLMAKTDSVYTEMLRRCVELEVKYDAVLNTVSTEQMDIICDFLTMTSMPSTPPSTLTMNSIL